MKESALPKEPVEVAEADLGRGFDWGIDPSHIEHVQASIVTAVNFNIAG